MFEDSPRLLVVCQPDKIHAHVFDQLHLLVEQFVRHGRRIASVIFVPAGPAQQQTVSVQVERPMLDKLGVANSEGLVRHIA